VTFNQSPVINASAIIFVTYLIPLPPFDCLRVYDMLACVRSCDV